MTMGYSFAGLPPTHYTHAHTTHTTHTHPHPTPTSPTLLTALSILLISVDMMNGWTIAMESSSVHPVLEYASRANSVACVHCQEGDAHVNIEETLKPVSNGFTFKPVWPNHIIMWFIESGFQSALGAFTQLP